MAFTSTIWQSINYTSVPTGLDYTRNVHFTSLPTCVCHQYHPDRAIVSAIGYFNKINNLPDPSVSFMIVKTLQGFTRLRSSVDARLPTKRTNLHRLVDSLQQMTRSKHDDTLFRSMFLLALFRLCMIGEINRKSSVTYTFRI